MRLALTRYGLPCRYRSPCMLSGVGSLEQDAATASAGAGAVLAAPTSGLTIGKLIGASVASGLIVWAITKWLDGGST